MSIAVVFTVTIAGVDRTSYLKAGSINLDRTLGARGEFSFALVDKTYSSGGYRPAVRDAVILKQSGTTRATGRITKITEGELEDEGQGSATGTRVLVEVSDNTSRLDNITVTKTYPSGTTLKAAMTDLVSTYLGGTGIALDAGMATGPTLDNVVINNATFTDALNYLTRITFWPWRLQPGDIIEMFSVGTKTASYSLTSANHNAIGGVSYTKSEGAYANRVILTAGTPTQIDKTDTFTTTLGQTSWALSYPIATATGRGYITVTPPASSPAATPVGIFGVNATLYTIDKATSTIHRTSAPPVGTVISITYPAQFPITVQVDDTGEQASFGIWAARYTAEAIFDKTTATDYATGLLTRDKTVPQIVTVVTRQALVSPGDTITLTFANRLVTGTYLITSVSATEEEDRSFRLRLTCVSGSQVPSTWQDYFRGGAGDATANGGDITGSALPNLSGHYSNDVSANNDNPDHAVVLQEWASSAAFGGAIFFNGADFGADSWVIVADTLSDPTPNLQFVPPADAALSGWAMNLTQALGFPTAGIYWLLPSPTGELHLGDAVGGPSNYGPKTAITSITTIDLEVTNPIVVGGVAQGIWTTYTPAWTSSGTAPSLGNGTLRGKWMLDGTTVHFAIHLTAGSTTTYGTGAYAFSLPFATGSTLPSVICGGDLTIFDNSAAAFLSPGTVAAGAGGSTTVFGITATGALVTNTIPVTFAVSDQIRLTGFYDQA